MRYYTWKNKFNLKSAQVWFSNLGEYKSIDANIIHLSGYSNPIKGSIYKKQETLIIDLKKSNDEIFNSINKTVKYEINRSNKEELNTKMLDSKSITDDVKSKFTKCYNKMYEEKGIDCHLNLDEFERYINADMLMFSYVYDNEEILAYHVYVCDEKTTRLLYSCSTFREDDSKKALIGRANKFLHWKDILFFKNNNYLIYDFGGIVSYENPNGIDKFKINFGGELFVYYNIVLGKGILGKTLVFLLKLKH